MPSGAINYLSYRTSLTNDRSYGHRGSCEPQDCASASDAKLTLKIEYTQAAGRIPEARTRSSTEPANWAKLTSKRRATSLAVAS